MPAKKIAWGTFYGRKLDWSQGEHLTLLGPTGSGKTTLALQLLQKHPKVIILGTKPRDTLLRTLVDRGPYDLIRKGPIPAGSNRVVYWPSISSIAQLEDKEWPGRAEIRDHVLDHIYKEGLAGRGWTLYVDEVSIVTGREYLNLGRIMSYLWSQGRSSGISVAAGTQRPAGIPRGAYSEPRHFFFWRLRDRGDLERIREIGGSSDPKEVATLVQSLGRYEVLYLDSVEGTMWRTRANRLAVAA